jgi:MFS family permease
MPETTAAAGPGESVKVYQPGGPQAYYALALLCLAFFFDYADRFILSSLLPFIKADWGLSDQALGLLTGVLSIPMAILVIPLSIVVDRWSRRKMLALMVAIWSLATLACAFTRNFGQLLVARALTGVGEAGYAPASIATIGAAFPQQARGKATGIWDAFAPLGSAVGFLLGGYIGLKYGWRHAFGLVALPGLLLAVAFMFMRDYQTVPLGDGSAVTPQKGELKKSTAELFKIRSLVFVWIGFALNFAVNTPVMAWLPSYLHRFHGMDEQKAGTMAGMLALMVLIGAPLGGILADRWMKKRIDARMRLSGLTSIASAILLISALLLAHTPFFKPLIVGFGILSVAFLAPAAAVIQDVVHPGLRAVAYGINVFCLQLFGASWTPWLVGRLSDTFGLERALMITPLFALTAGLVFLLGTRHYGPDLARVKQVVLLEE